MDVGHVAARPRFNAKACTLRLAHKNLFFYGVVSTTHSSSDLCPVISVSHVADQLIIFLTVPEPRKFFEP